MGWTLKQASDSKDKIEEQEDNLEVEEDNKTINEIPDACVRWSVPIDFRSKFLWAEGFLSIRTSSKAFLVIKDTDYYVT